MCGEDGVQREVYKLKEEPERRGSEKEKKRRETKKERENEREESKRGKWYYSLKTNIRETN